MKTIASYFVFAMLCLAVFTNCSKGTTDKAENMTNPALTYENNKVRLALITVDSMRLEEYNQFLKEEIEASMKIEPGVLLLYAVADKEQPNKITILEIYADEEAYQQHLKTPHFLKYKEGTLDMVQSLELIEAAPLIPGLKIKQGG